MSFVSLIFHKARLSLHLDLSWIRIPENRYTWQYIIKKYVFIVLSPLFWDRASTSYSIRLLGRRAYIPTVEHVAFLQGTYIDHAYLATYIGTNPTIIDIGAHTGEFAIVCETILDPKTIFSFEPIEQSYTLLKHNKRDHIYHFGIGTKQHQMMYIGKNTVTASGIMDSPEDRTEVVSCKKLDDIQEIRSLERIELLKIDVEGMEYDVIQASKTTIQKSEYILIEISFGRESKATTFQTIELLRSYVPRLRLVHIGNVFYNRDHTTQVAVDMLFHNPDPQRL